MHGREEYEYMMRRGMHPKFRMDRHPFYRPEYKKKPPAAKR